MGKFFKALLFGLGVYAAVHFSGGGLFEKNIAATLAPGNEVVMYSLTTCPYCREKRQWMTRVGIPFREYFIDSDEARRRSSAHCWPPAACRRGPSARRPSPSTANC